jgi:membrane protease subunit HflK
MLTEDENIVAIDIAAQYRVKDASDYAFEVRLPDVTLMQLMESAVREVVGTSTMDYVLGAGRADVAADTQVLMQKALDQYRSGLEVVTVNLQQAQPPEPVQPAFADAVMAREDEVRFTNQAQSYANGTIPRARGQAARIAQEAVAYRDKVIAAAEGDATRFLQLLSEYSQAPEVTRDRLYLDAMQSVLSNSSKVMLDVDGGNNLLYLPLDRLMQGGRTAANTGPMRNFPIPQIRGGSFDDQADEREARSFGREER